jgi:hypothetical protein
MGVIGGVLAENSSGMGIDLDSYLAEAAPLDPLTLLDVAVSLPLIFLSAPGSLACTDEKPRSAEQRALISTPSRSPCLGWAELNAVSMLLILKPFMEVLW